MFITRPLLITRDRELADDVFRIAAVAGCELDHVDPDDAERGWPAAPVVLVDDPSATVLAESGVRRRSSVLVVCHEAGPELWRAAFEIGAERALELPADEADLVDLLAECLNAEAPRSGQVLAVLGGRGGAGASVLAAATALAAARRGDRCLLLDCDPLGGGLDLTVGTEADAGLRWSGLTVSGGRVGVAALHEVLPEREIGSGAVSVLSCDRDGASAGLTPQAVGAVIEGARRAGETVVCDVPRSLPEAAAVAVRLADLAVVVVPAEVRACASARRVLAELRDVAACPVSAVVRGPGPGGLTIADVRRSLGVDVLAAMRGQHGVPGAVDRGGLWPGARGPLARAADAVLRAMDAAPSEALVGAG